MILFKVSKLSLTNSIVKYSMKSFTRTSILSYEPIYKLYSSRQSTSENKKGIHSLIVYSLIILPFLKFTFISLI